MRETEDRPKLQPHDREAEQAILGAVLLDPIALAHAQEVLTANDFYDSRHQRIFTAMCELAGRNEPIDTVTLSGTLEASGDLPRIGGRAALAELVNAVASATNIRQHCHIVRDCVTLRRLIRFAAELEERAYRKETAQDLVREAERILSRIASNRAPGHWCPNRALVQEVMDYVDRAFKNDRAITGIPTGFKDLDRLLGGWQPSDLDIIASRPSMGKTSFALGTALAAAKAGYRVGILSLEMSRLQLGLRLHAMQAPVDLHSLRSGRMPSEGWTRLACAAQDLEPLTIWTDDTGTLTVEQLRAKARRLKAQEGLDLLLLDYLQLLQLPRAETRQQGIADASRQLKLLAKELNIPVLALSQLSRACELRDDKHPVLADLRDSGAIEQDADVVLFLYREEVYVHDTDEKGMAEVLIRKHRSGPIGDRRLAFIAQYAKFADLAPQAE